MTALHVSDSKKVFFRIGRLSLLLCCKFFDYDQFISIFVGHTTPNKCICFSETIFEFQFLNAYSLFEYKIFKSKELDLFAIRQFEIWSFDGGLKKIKELTLKMFRFLNDLFFCWFGIEVSSVIWYCVLLTIEEYSIKLKSTLKLFSLKVSIS